MTKDTRFEDSLFNECELPAVLGLFPTFKADSTGKTIRTGLENCLEINNLPRQLNRATLSLELNGSEENETKTNEGDKIFHGSSCRVSNCRAVLPFKITNTPKKDTSVTLSVKTQAGEELARIASLAVDSREAGLVCDQICIDYLKNGVTFVPCEQPPTFLLTPPQTSQESQTPGEPETPRESQISQGPIIPPLMITQELDYLSQLSRILSQRIVNLQADFNTPRSGPSRERSYSYDSTPNSNTKRETSYKKDTEKGYEYDSDEPELEERLARQGAQSDAILTPLE
eukprot:Phypoly_transcript_05232.p1 GENE.Phypoly_transcript_05232~~Phypoly_transcript_05232.p1  ORF type:complete len:286 (+),score=46.46 Phypoly_transcript_05232:150-1007(+)